jgi:hypothetical protein
MHVENELVEFVTAGDHEYAEIVEEYEEEIVVPEEILKPPLTDFADTPPAQGKPWCITLILQVTIYICCAFTLQEFYDTHRHVYLPMSLTSAGSCSRFA